MALSLGCKNQSEGLAPSEPLPPGSGAPPSSPSSAESLMKYAETQSLANGWEVSLDTSDPVETIQLANGWTVEVVHE